MSDTIGFALAIVFMAVVYYFVRKLFENV